EPHSQADVGGQGGGHPLAGFAVEDQFGDMTRYPGAEGSQLFPQLADQQQRRGGLLFALVAHPFRDLEDPGQVEMAIRLFPDVLEVAERRDGERGLPFLRAGAESELELAEEKFGLGDPRFEVLAETLSAALGLLSRRFPELRELAQLAGLARVAAQSSEVP